VPDDPSLAARRRHRALGQDRRAPYYQQTLEASAATTRLIDGTRLGSDLPKKVRDAILYGTGDEEVIAL
jgi:hypothetical protein